MIAFLLIWLIPFFVILFGALYMNIDSVRANKNPGEKITIGELFHYTFHNYNSIFYDETVLGIALIPSINILLMLFLLALLIYTGNEKLFDNKILPALNKIHKGIKYTFKMLWKIIIWPIKLPFKIIGKIFDKIMTIKI